MISPGVNWDEVRNRYVESGLTVAELSRELGLKYFTVRYQCLRGKWPELREERSRRSLERTLGDLPANVPGVSAVVVRESLVEGMEARAGEVEAFFGSAVKLREAWEAAMERSDDDSLTEAERQGWARVADMHIARRQVVLRIRDLAPQKPEAAPVRKLNHDISLD